MDDYKIKQLEIMLEYEESAPEDSKYGAHLDHWSGRAKPINIDAGALRCLIDYYSKKENI